MLVTKQPVFKRFWYPVIPSAELSGEPKAFELLGEPIVLWLDSEGKPAAVEDRCCHRTAKLSIGKVVGSNICYAYRGWTFNLSGTCVCVPQQQNGIISPNYKVKAYRTCRSLRICLGLSRRSAGRNSRYSRSCCTPQSPRRSRTNSIQQSVVSSQ
ncbi:Rieske 2Fe-2S domain-containing protein [Microcoleus sp. Pol11C1]|uniref:Rieske 2Fe-2S domain-containing protein n=1 Tax=unclassified Microcoleus TaxID=2642155 RepID=UPI002FD59E01